MFVPAARYMHGLPAVHVLDFSCWLISNVEKKKSVVWEVTSSAQASKDMMGKM